MKLVHYTNAPIGPLHAVEQPAHDAMKPHGFWVSDDDCETNWRTWCEGEEFRLGYLTHAHDVALSPGANICLLTSAAELDAFSAEWFRGGRFEYATNWRPICEKYDGLIITPYIWERRLSMDRGLSWYYGWDCASGCIWNPRAIASITLREMASEKTGE